MLVVVGCIYQYILYCVVIMILDNPLFRYVRLKYDISRLMILLQELAVGQLEFTREEFIVISRGGTIIRRDNQDLKSEKEREIESINDVD